MHWGQVGLWQWKVRPRGGPGGVGPPQDSQGSRGKGAENTRILLSQGNRNPQGPVEGVGQKDGRENFWNMRSGPNGWHGTGLNMRG